MKAAARGLTTFTVGFLVLDAILLLYSGARLGRPLLMVGGGVCSLAAGLVVLGWRRYRRAMAELEQARRDLRAEADSIRDLLPS
jgi:hypothetical protein